MPRRGSPSGMKGKAEPRGTTVRSNCGLRRAHAKMSSWLRLLFHTAALIRSVDAFLPHESKIGARIHQKDGRFREDIAGRQSVRSRKARLTNVGEPVLAERLYPSSYALPMRKVGGDTRSIAVSTLLYKVLNLEHIGAQWLADWLVKR